MKDTLRIISPLDRLISLADHALKNSFGQPPAAGRSLPADRNGAADAALNDEERRRSAALMRVNHAGEIAAQALYHGQALVAADPAVRDFLLEAAREEGDHLVWCAERLQQLDSRTSLLSPVWYAGSALIGALAGWSGDAISLGFIAETERQVEGHIDEHLQRLPERDQTSRAILAQMKIDESEHREHAMARGGAALRAPIPSLMRATAKIMTGCAYWI
jgi:ubiquinone biosynthesis monooxygenase Coq7